MAERWKRHSKSAKAGLEEEHSDAQDADLSGAVSGFAVHPERRRHRALWAALVAGMIVIGFVFVIARAPQTTQLDANSPLIGKIAPTFEGVTLAGRRFSLAELRGHVVVVDFFSSWCVPCRTEQPELEQFVAEQSGPNGARLVGVVFLDSVSNIRRWLGPVTSLYPMVSDPGGAIALDYGVANPPSKYLIDSAGRIYSKVIGPVTAAELDRLVALAPKNDQLKSSSGTATIRH